MTPDGEHEHEHEHEWYLLPVTHLAWDVICLQCHKIEVWTMDREPPRDLTRMPLLPRKRRHSLVTKWLKKIKP